MATVLYNARMNLPAWRLRERIGRSAVLVTLALGFGFAARLLSPGVVTQAPTGFAADIAALSEPGGYFDTDNLISNEASYLDVVPALSQHQVKGGVYIGVGPDQNYTYIAATRPSIAFILDIRRDNMLLHLLFKALFGLAGNRVEYLSLLLGRRLPAESTDWGSMDIERIVTGLNRAALDETSLRSFRSKVDAAITRMGVPLSDDDIRTIERFHRRFIEAGFDLRFQSTGRPPRSYYPTYRDLLLATDPSGRRACFLASEGSFQFVKGLHARDLIVPVVGDVSGSKAFAAIGRFVQQRGERVSALYVSNVEFYLFSSGSFPRYLVNIRNLPRASNAVVIRSVFSPYSSSPSMSSSSHVQSMAELLARADDRRITRYADLLTR
jgi:hypothetical protein